MLDKWFGLSGKCALVVGASQGLGREIALALAQAGADVAGAARHQEKLEGLAQEIGALGRRALSLPMDVTQEEQVVAMARQLAEAWSRVDILVYSAGTLRAKPTLDSTLADWHQTLDINLTGAFLVCREVGQLMRQQGGGRIILISSAFGDRVLPQVLPYVVSKGGLQQMVRNLAFEWARYGIRVNGVAPGYFHTEMPGPALADPATREAILRRIPLRRVGQPPEIGPLIVYLAAPASDFMTGEVIRIDGGQSYCTV